MADHEGANVLSWYDASRPLFIDLIGDYAGKELFLVEGDSLLRECFSDERIDFKGKSLLSVISSKCICVIPLHLNLPFLLSKNRGSAPNDVAEYREGQTSLQPCQRSRIPHIERFIRSREFC
jgi:hypothetical protein